ncbi:MAG: hypothetical protein AAFN07_15155 [Pseudomonadota bacterium]
MLHRVFAGFALGVLLTGCGTAIKVRSAVMPDAAVVQLPLTAAVRLNESITDFSYEEKLAIGGTYSINLGDASATMLTTTFDDLFQNVVLLEGEAATADADIVIEPTLSALEFVVPSQTISSDYAIWMKYQIKVFDSSGKLQADYLIPAYGKAPKDSVLGGAKAALSVAADRALRDASTVLLTRFVADAKLSGNQLRPVQQVADQSDATRTIESAPAQDDEPVVEPPTGNNLVEHYL